MNNRKKYLVTGAAGFVGHHLVQRILNNGDEVIGMDNFHFGKREYIESFLPNNDFKMFEGSINDSEFVKSVIQNEKPDHLINLAALHFIPYCVANPKETLQVNLAGTQTLLDSLKNSTIKKFIYISSGDVYQPSDLPNKETDPVKPFNMYGLSKLMGEQLVELVEKDLPEVKFNIVRLFNVYGPGETNPHILPDIMTQLKKGKVLKLGNITPVRDYIFTDDVVDGLMRIDQYSGEEKLFNLAGGTPCSVEKLIEIISMILNEKIVVEKDLSRVRKVERQNLIADLSKINKELKWEPKISLEEGLRATILAEGLLIN